jgi:predicted nucleotidyltransferase
MKKALNMYLNIADDVYRNQVEDMELSDKQKNDIIELSAKISKGRLEEIIKLVANQVIHGGNFKVSYAKLKREAEIE